MNDAMREGAGRAGRAVAGAAVAAGRQARALMAAALLLGLAACGGGGSSGSAPVARVEILSAGAWLAGAGQTRELSARAFDADGNPVDAAITWTSSRPGAVAVDAQGRLSSLVVAGSAQISAQAGGVTSAPILAFVAAPAAGVTVVEDAAIADGPVETVPAATPSLANTYQVMLDGPAPALGALLLGDGDKPLAGRVTAVEPAGTQTRVTLQLVPVAELFASLEIEELFDLSRAEVLVPPEVSDFFDVARSGDTWTFTPKPRTSSERRRPTAASGSPTRDLAPFRGCESSLVGVGEDSEPPVSFEVPTISITLSPTVDLLYSRLGGLSRFIVNAEPKVETELKLKGDAALGGELKCALRLFALRLPIGGPLSWFFGGVVPVGLGFEAKLQATVASFSVGAQTEASSQAALGWTCTGPECAWVGTLGDAAVELEPDFDMTAGPEDLRLEAEATLYGTVKAELGNPVLRSLRFDALEARIGGAVEGNFAPPVTQLIDTAYASDYKASLKGGAEAGVGIQALFELLGLGSVVTLEVTLDEPLASSPKSTNIEADRATFAAGDIVNVQVTLDPATLDFLPGVYNVDSVQLRRRAGSVTETLATQVAGSGQQVFDFSVSAPYDGNVSEWTAFVTTRLLPVEVASLELGRVGSGEGIVLIDTVSGVNSMCEAAVNNPRTDQSDYQYVDFFDAVPNPTCSAAAGTARASVSVTAVVTGPVLAIGSAVPTSGTLAFDASLEIRPTVATADPDDRAAAFGQGTVGTTWIFRIGAETRLRITQSYTSAGGANAGGGVSIRAADGTLRTNVPAGVHELVLQPGDTISVSVGGSGMAGDYINGNVSPLPPTFATTATSVLLEFNP